MSALKKYLKHETHWRMLGLEHSNPSDFYLSVWQRNQSAVPLLIWRAALFLTSLGITLTSLITYGANEWINYWCIYLTHWGLTLITLTTAFAVIVSARSYLYGPFTVSAELKLPWYVKTYWVLYNIAIPLAFLISIFFWTLLYDAGIEEELNHGLDVAVHGVNSVIMFLLLASSSQPSRPLHVYQPLLFALVYIIFGAIYYAAGGVNTDGKPWVYPMVNWAKPGPTIGLQLITGLVLLLVHMFVAAIAAARDDLSVKLLKPPVAANQTEGVPLGQITA